MVRRPRQFGFAKMPTGNKSSRRPNICRGCKSGGRRSAERNGCNAQRWRPGSPDHRILSKLYAYFHPSVHTFGPACKALTGPFFCLSWHSTTSLHASFFEFTVQSAARSVLALCRVGSDREKRNLVSSDHT